MRRNRYAAVVVVVIATAATAAVGLARRPRSGASSVQVASAVPPTGNIDKRALGGTPCNCYLTPADLAAQDRSDAAFFARRAAFITKFAKTHFDPARLAQDETTGDLIAPPPTLRLAAAQAPAIVDGTVDALHYSPNGTTADFTVIAASKGPFPPGAVIPVALGFQLEPNSTFTGALFGVTPTSPVLLPGSEAVLLLGHDRGGTWYAESGAQAFLVSHGVVVSPPGSTPFRSKVNGLTPRELLAATK